jgi:hypothetical protein
MAKKHLWHCERCGNECMIYKKGKNHKVLVCPHHGVIATNPISGLVKGLVKGGLSAVPVVGGLLSGVAGGLMDSAGGSGKTPTQTQPRERVVIRQPVLVDLGG